MTVEWSHWLAQSWRNCKNNCQNPNQDCKNKKLERIGAQKDPGKLELRWLPEKKKSEIWLGLR